MDPVLAYLDPGTGSVILQALLGGIAGVAVTLKLFGRRVVSTSSTLAAEATTRKQGRPQSRRTPTVRTTAG